MHVYGTTMITVASSWNTYVTEHIAIAYAQIAHIFINSNICTASFIMAYENKNLNHLNNLSNKNSIIQLLFIEVLFIILYNILSLYVFCA